MSDIGAEVGQKMRLAIKAKLTELNCYVDDELPDYIMVMIANKRTKSQMKEDLNLFLSNETSFFVEWLHIVLKKLKQVHVTNPNVFKNPIKRKSNEYVISQEDMKKVKKEEGKIKRERHQAAMDGNGVTSMTDETIKSLTDDLPITANSISEAGRRKIVLVDSGNNIALARSISNDDDFDIPLLSEINASNEEELELLERRIKNVKSRLGLQVPSDEDDNDGQLDEDCLSIKPDPGDLEFAEQSSKTPPLRRIAMGQKRDNTGTGDVENEERTVISVRDQMDEMKRSIHARITFDKEKDSLRARYDSILKRTRAKRNEASPEPEGRKRSILDRLGKRPESKIVRPATIKSTFTKLQKDKYISDSKMTSTILSRVGVLSKVSIPLKKNALVMTVNANDTELSEREELKMNVKNVASVVKVTPRKLPAKTKQANPNLLFKAVAEAQRSVTQTPSVGAAETKNTKRIMIGNKIKATAKPSVEPAPALFTKKYKEQLAASIKGQNKRGEVKHVEMKKSIIINNSKKAKLMEDEKLKLRILLSNRQNNEPKRVIEKKICKEFDSEEEDDELLLEPEFNDDFEEYDQLERERRSENREKSPVQEEKQITFKRKVEIEDNDKAKVQEPRDEIIDEDQVERKDAEPKINQKFIVTLDGIDKLKYAHIDQPNSNAATINFPDTMIKTRRTPSPIVFAVSKPVEVVAPMPSRVPATKTQAIVKKIEPIGKKSKDKCKYFPNCRQGDRCEFLHPTACKMFPNCKFAEQCLYAHPMCKFEASCTRKNCPYSHPTAAGIVSTKPVAISSTVCKYFPNCSNGNCSFYHPKLCKYGLHCKNKLCAFQHPGGNHGNKLTWRPDK